LGKAQVANFYGNSNEDAEEAKVFINRTLVDDGMSDNMFFAVKAPIVLTKKFHRV